MKKFKSAVLLYLILTLLTGVVYPLAVTAVARFGFQAKAEGSLLRVNGEVRGSKLIGQNFSSPQYFWPRPSASDYSALPSAASNLGPTSASLQKLVDQRRAALAPFIAGPIPSDLLLASASGLDPEISPAAAFSQVGHVAQARGLSARQKADLIALVRHQVKGPQWGIFGSPRINVLELNVALDDLFKP